MFYLFRYLNLNAIFILAFDKYATEIHIGIFYRLGIDDQHYKPLRKLILYNELSHILLV